MGATGAEATGGSLKESCGKIVKERKSLTWVREKKRLLRES